MKYKLLAIALGVTEVSLKNGIFGGVTEVSLKNGIFGGKPFVSFNEEQLEKIEKALAVQSNEELQQSVTALMAENAEMKATSETVTTAVNKALGLNGLEQKETLAESVELLGTTCKEYGEKKPTHTITKNDGKEVEVEEDGLLLGYIDPNAAHNKILGIGQNVE